MNTHTPNSAAANASAAQAAPCTQRTPRTEPQITELLHQCGFKSTLQRLAVFEALDQLGHASADAVVGLVQSRNPRITTATVYRVLDSFAQAELISRLSTPCGKIHFDVTPTVHHHVYYSDGRIEDLHDDLVAEMLNSHFDGRSVDGKAIQGVRLQVFLD